MVGLASLFALLVASPAAFANGGWAVIVWNPQTNSAGSSHGESTRATGESLALSYCGSGCAGATSATLEASGSVVRETWVLNGWVALATDDFGHFGSSGTHDNQADAEQAALANCGNSNCFVLRSLSSFVSSPDINGTDNFDRLTPISPTPVADVTYYCAAACISSTGVADDRYTASATSTIQLEANQNAINATQSKFSCNFGVTVLGCAEEIPGAVYDASAACVSSTGSPDLRYIADGQGSSLLEAETNARISVQATDSCNFSIADIQSSEGLRTTYCTAACVDSTGTADESYSLGEQGRDQTQAMVNALSAVQSNYSCNFGVVITGCD